MAVDEALRTEGLPALDLWATICCREVKLRLQEDNDACRIVVVSGKNPNIRCMNRTHKINIAWVHESYRSGLFELDRCPSNEMEADIFTKPIVKPDYWRNARLNISIAWEKEATWAKVGKQVATPCTANAPNRELLEF